MHVCVSGYILFYWFLSFPCGEICLRVSDMSRLSVSDPCHVLSLTQIEGIGMWFLLVETWLCKLPAPRGQRAQHIPKKAQFHSQNSDSRNIFVEHLCVMVLLLTVIPNKSACFDTFQRKHFSKW